MKPTLRRNGKHMATVMVTHYIDGDMLARALAVTLYESSTLEDDFDEDARITKAAAEEAVRNHLFYRGEELLEYWSEQVCDPKAAWAWSVRRIRELWPEMAEGLSEDLP